MAEWKEQSLRLWQNQDKKQKYAAIGVASLLLIAILVWSYWLSARPDNVALFTGLDAKDAGEVVAALQEMKIPYELQDNGSTIMVSSKDVHQIRLDLAGQGLPKGNKGFEIFEESKFGVTEFQNKVNLLQAVQGELTRTIEQINEVEKARVHIVMPEESLYRKDEKPASASIMLKIKNNGSLNKNQIKGIVNLVAHSIQGLKAENITVVDSLARVLNEEENEDGMGTTTLTQFDLTKKVKDDLEKTIQTLLDRTLGQNKATARVSVELNFDHRTTDRQTFAPVVDDRGVLRSTQEASETYNGTSTQPGGIPGTATNIPGYVAPEGNTESEYEKTEATRNYEVNETKEKIVSAPGSIRRLTVAVLVDTTIPQAQRDSLSRTVALAAGINPERGDSIVVEGIPFSTELADRIRLEEETAAQEEQQIRWAMIAGAVLILLALLYFYRERKRRIMLEQEAADLLAASQLQAELDAYGLPVGDQAITPEEQMKLDQQEIIMKLARSNPEEVAQLLRAWLADE
jgi:flagellar M-ring protein FliF